MGGDENLKKYLAWPYFSILVNIASCKAGLFYVWYFEFYQVVDPDDRFSRCIAHIIGPETGRESKLL